MVVEKELEAKIITALSLALADVEGVRVFGVWQSTNDGEVKGLEIAADHALVSVAVGAPEYDTFMTPIASLPVSIGIVIRQECAPTAAALETIYGPIESVLVGLQLDAVETSLSSLTSTHFRADGVRLDSGSAPQFNSANSAWTISRSLTVRGVIINN